MILGVANDFWKRERGIRKHLDPEIVGFRGSKLLLSDDRKQPMIENIFLRY